MSSINTIASQKVVADSEDQKVKSLYKYALSLSLLLPLLLYLPRITFSVHGELLSMNVLSSRETPPGHGVD